MCGDDFMRFIRLEGARLLRKNRPLSIHLQLYPCMQNLHPHPNSITHQMLVKGFYRTPEVDVDYSVHNLGTPQWVC